MTPGLRIDVGQQRRLDLAGYNDILLLVISQAPSLILPGGEISEGRLSGDEEPQDRKSVV